MNSLVIGYLIAINMATCVVRGRDKYRSQSQGRRVSENTLLTLSACGGIGGGLLGMKFFRHKTIKGSFQTKFFLICGLRIVLLLLFLYLS